LFSAFPIHSSARSRHVSWLAPFTTALRQSVLRAAVAGAALCLMALYGLAEPRPLAKTLLYLLLANTGVGALAAMAGNRRFASGSAIAINAALIVHFCVEGFLYLQYGLTFTDSVVLDALGAANTDEILEFLGHYWPTMLLVGSFGSCAIGILAWLEQWLPEVRAADARSRAIGGGIAILFAALHFNPTMRAENPFFYWPRYYTAYHESAEQLAEMRAVMARAQDAEELSYVGPEKHTVVLVVGESVNRSNLSLYGYQRKTTPHLDALRKELLVFGDVLSSDAATIQSVVKMLTPATLANPGFNPSKPSVLKQARQAGYEVHWISNQQRNDGPIQMLAEQADHSVFINQRTGRKANSLDGGLIPHLKGVLESPAPRKFIVVHLMGAHLDYDLRYPQSFARFQDADDPVYLAMKEASRPFWVRNARNQYDNAILYGDHVLHALLGMLQQAAGGDPATFVYVSDHGQEVGHSRNFSGHSASDPSGYEIPLIMWTNREDKLAAVGRDELEARPYQADVLDHTIVGLLDIRTASYRAEADLLHPLFKGAERYLNGRHYTAAARRSSL
jgi:heptose-I-phosphate ethanolaminephosphotransferase